MQRAPAEGVPEGGGVGKRFGAGVDQAVADGRGLRPEGNESPPELEQLALLSLNHHRHRLRRGDVVARRQLEEGLLDRETFSELRRRGGEG